MKNVIEKLKKFISDLNSNENYNETFKTRNIVLILSKLLTLFTEKLHNGINKENNDNDEMKNQLIIYILENILKYLKINDKNLNDLIFENNFFNIFKFSVENYNKKFDFINPLIENTFEILFKQNILSDLSEERILILNDYFKLFWNYNAFTKGKFNEEISDIILHKISLSKNHNFVKILLKLVIDNLFDVIIILIF